MNQSGFTIVGIIASLGVASTLALMLGSANEIAFRTTRGLSQNYDFDLLNREIKLTLGDRDRCFCNINGKPLVAGEISLNEIAKHEWDGAVCNPGDTIIEEGESFRGLDVPDVKIVDLQRVGVSDRFTGLLRVSLENPEVQAGQVNRNGFNGTPYKRMEIPISVDTFAGVASGCQMDSETSLDVQASVCTNMLRGTWNPTSRECENHRPITCTKDYTPVQTEWDDDGDIPFPTGGNDIRFGFDPADCTDGVLPDSSYTGSISNLFVCASSDGSRIIQPSENFQPTAPLAPARFGPGVEILEGTLTRWLAFGNCFANPDIRNRTISVSAVFVKK